MAASESSTIRITVPIELSISIGTVQAGGVAVQADAGAAQPAGHPQATGSQATGSQATGSQATGPAAERAVEPDHDTDYANRTGYDPGFLGTDVPPPTASDPSVLCVPQGGGTLLHYRHFSIAMHRRRRLALFTASNVTADAGLKRPENRPDADYTRRGLGGLDRNDRERWFGDPRIRADEQLPDRFFEQDRGSFDKGHVVRREDVAWGRTYVEMRAANGDTFHVTNCTPQISAFNQASRGEDNWGDLEDLVQAHAKTERLAVFAGPVLADDDPVFTGLDTEGPVAVPVPVRFWKVIVANGEGGLQAFGFLLEQDLSAVALEFTVPARWRRFMAPLTRIETLTGVDFPARVRAADQHDRRSGRQFREAAESGPAAAGGTTAGSPGPAAPVPEIGEILAAWKAQAGTPSAADVRFVVELAAPLADPTLEAIAARILGLPLTVGPLFAADRDLDRFRVLEIQGVVSDDRADLFDVARALNAAFGSRSVEPDLAARYFDDDRPPPAEGTAESADSAFWCWVPDTPGTRPQNPDWALRETSTYQAWTFSEASGKPPQGDGIVVFQPDTGVVPWHRELPPGVAQDGRAANFVEGGPGAVDPLTGGGNPGHGTGTGSVVASPQGGAMSGSAPRATLVPLRCVTSVAVFNQSRVAQAVDHARRHGAHVITMSLGGVPSQALHEAIRKAVDDNVVVVAAAGNCVGTVVWPARYDEVIAVGGVNETFRPWKGSSRGSAVDISGPAEFVLRAEATDAASPDKVGGGQGTSFATAHLAGIAACWLAHHGRAAIVASLAPGETLQQRFLAKLAQTATVPPDFDRDEYGAGIVNASKLLRADALAAGAAEAGRRRRSIEEQVAELLAEAGAGGLEAAGTVRREPQNVLELACIGLDLARRGQASGLRLEAQPPPAMSRGLRQALGRTAGGGR